MNKWSGKIGFFKTIETVPGVWEETIEERKYYGDVIRSSRRLQNTGQVNDDINISNQISVLSDPYADNNIYSMKYVTFMGAKWKITDVEVQYPRLLLTLGGVYND